jgi:hypothetical protein
MELTISARSEQRRALRSLRSRSLAFGWEEGEIMWRLSEGEAVDVMVED